MDYGPQPVLTTLDMYDQRGWLYFGGGRDLQDSLQPALVGRSWEQTGFYWLQLCRPAQRLGNGFIFPVQPLAILTSCQLN